MGKITKGEEQVADRKKKLLFVSEALWIGGIETALVNLLNALDYDKYEVTCLILRAELAMAGRITPNCRLLAADRERTVSFPRAYGFSRLYHLTEESTEASLLHRCLMWAVPAVKWLENRLYIRYIRSCLQGESFDSCIIYSDRTAETAVRAVKADRFVLFYHHGAMRRVYHDEIGYRRAEKIVTVSERTVDMLRQFRPEYGEKVTAIHNLTDIGDVRRRAGEPPKTVFPEGGFHLVTCGRLQEAKGMDWAIRACRLLLDRGYGDIHWWIVGGGPEEEALKALIDRTGTGEHVHLLGMQDNPYPYIAAADLYVQPSRYENHSVVILEAMVLEKPILATVPAGTGQIRSGENGRLCEPGPEGIAAGIEALYRSPRERERYIRYLTQHGLEQENAAIMAALERLFDGK